MERLERLHELTTLLSNAARAYYQEDREIMSNFEYDKLYDELLELEKDTGITLSNSPTTHVGYEVLSKLKKDKHEVPALSLDKTKDRHFVKSWLHGKDGVMGWKLDGLTVVLTYENGELVKAVTRGNGEIGEIITHNAKFFDGLPLKIACKSHIVVRGEAVIYYSTFDKINKQIPETENKYKNPRNLASGTVRQFDSKISAERHVHFKAFDLVSYNDTDLINDGFDPNQCIDHYKWMEYLGFDVVGYTFVNNENADKVIDEFESKIKENDFPSDGLVLRYNDIAYGLSLGTTGKFPRYGIAFKWKDELAETIIRKIEWNASRTGLINPVAVFDPVELEGTEVKRATSHNVSILKKLNLTVGSKITVYKANMIIPTINENIKPSGNEIEIPTECPVCHEPTHIHISDDGIETLYCENKKCPAKHIKSFVHFVKRDSMNILSFNEATIEKLIDAGFISKFKDIYTLKEHKKEIAELDGMGERSVENLLEAIETSRNTTLSRFLSGLGIPLVGRSACKEIDKYFHGNFNKFIQEFKNGFDFSTLTDFGDKMCTSLTKYLNDNLEMIEELSSYLNFETKELEDNKLQNITFVITGSLNHFSNRDELKNKIESLGGKVANAVSSRTTYLINNDFLSNSGKNKKAKELGIKIITEEDFENMIENV